jgi:hypothetical protein
MVISSTTLFKSDGIKSYLARFFKHIVVNDLTILLFLIKIESLNEIEKKHLLFISKMEPPDTVTENDKTKYRLMKFILQIINNIDYITGGIVTKYALNHNLPNQERLGTNNPYEFKNAIFLLEKTNRHFYKFNSFGKLAMLKQYYRNLDIRKSVNLYNKPLPKLKPAFIIVGLHRTGSTLLHRLLDLDPYAKTLKSWELMVGPLNMTQSSKKNIQSNFKMYNYLNPGLWNVHELEYNKPEEESIIINRMLSPFQIDLYTYLESVPKESKIQELAKSIYPYLKKEIQLYQMSTLGASDENFSHWVLKAPIHSLNIETLKETFPDSILIEIKRDLNKTIPSFCNLIYNNYAESFKDKIDKKMLGQKQIKTKKLMIDNLHKNRKLIDFTLDYNDFINNPVKTIEDIYKQIDIPFIYKQDIIEYLEISKKLKWGQRANYSLEEYGITPHMINQLKEIK